MTDMAVEAIATATSFSPLNTSLLAVAIGMLGLILRHQIAARKVKIEEDNSDRQGLSALVALLQGQVQRMDERLTSANDRIATLESERDRDHRLIIELFGQLSRNQAAAILDSNNVSPQLRRAMESLKDMGS